MPELPELEYYAGRVTEQLAGARLEACDFRPTKRTNVPIEALRAALDAGVLDRASRVGKELVLEFRDGPRLGVHLMLNGYVVVGESREAPKFGRATLEFGAAGTAWVCDPRGLVTFALDPDPPAAPDALSPELTEAYLTERFRAARKECVKATLMNQSVVGGIGSAYVDEILWHARIAPQSHSAQIPQERVDALLGAIREVLRHAVEQVALEARGQELDGYQPLRSFLEIHNPDRTHSPTGHAIRCEKVAGRTTYFTDEQTVYRAS